LRTCCSAERTAACAALLLAALLVSISMVVM